MTALRALAILVVVIPFADAVGWIYGPHGELEWSYEGGSGGPSNWITMFPQYCSGQHQSPINIDTEQAQEVKFDFLNMIGFGSQDRPVRTSFRVNNNGHAVELHITGDFLIDGGGLPGKQYKVAQLHYHWGHANAAGSEHTVNGKRYDAEMHLVTYDTQYPSLSEAKKHTDGVAVFAALIQIGFNPYFAGSQLDEFIDGVQRLSYKGDEYTFNESKLTQLSGFLPDNIDWFYRYRGSFTTPHCDEHVLWTIWEQVIVIPQAKMNVFYNLNGHKAGDATNVKLRDNFRPLQALNGREILHSHRNNW